MDPDPMWEATFDETAYPRSGAAVTDGSASASADPFSKMFTKKELEGMQHDGVVAKASQWDLLCDALETKLTSQPYVMFSQVPSRLTMHSMRERSTGH